MSIYVTTLVWKFSKASGSTLLTALAIADFADDEGTAYPAIATLAHKSRVSERTVQYAIRELCDLGELSVEAGTGPRGCNTFTLNIRALRMGGANSAGVQNTTEGGATGCTQTVRETVTEKKEKRAGERVTLADGRFTVPASVREKWAGAYPGVDLDGEIARAEAWVANNLSRAPRSQAGRFLNAWMARAQSDLTRKPALKVVHGSNRKQAARDQMADWLFSDHRQKDDSNVIDVVATERR